MRAFQRLAGLMAIVYATLAQGAAPAPAPKPDLERGKQIAATVCVACHGPDGNSPAPANPILAGQHADYAVVLERNANEISRPLQAKFCFQQAAGIGDRLVGNTESSRYLSKTLALSQ